MSAWMFLRDLEAGLYSKVTFGMKIRGLGKRQSSTVARTVTPVITFSESMSKLISKTQPNELFM